MDLNNLSPSPSPSPAQPKIRRQESQRNLCLSDNNPYKNLPSPPVWPQRISSVCQKESSSTARVSIASEWTDGYVSDAEKSTAEKLHDLYASNSPSVGIIGNFIPIPSPASKMDGRYGVVESAKPLVNSSSTYVPASRSANIYEFEPDSPYFRHDPRHETRFEDFIPIAYDEHPDTVPRPLHVKNAPSTSITQSNMPAAKESGHRMQRSESSPSMNPGRFPDERFQDNRRLTMDSPNVNGDYAESEGGFSTRGRGRSPARMRHYNKYGEVVEASSNFEVQKPRNSDTDSNSRRQDSRHNTTEIIHVKTVSDLDILRQEAQSPSHRIRSPTRVLADVIERDETNAYVESPMPPSLASPRKRSRSPMKKMFGEHGWLGRTPTEGYQYPKQRVKTPDVQPSPRKEKISMMGKIRSKFGEFAEKAELSPHTNRPDKLPILSVSVSAPEQAKIYMELELMIVISANAFLMNQFSQGRINVDTIKKTVDTWKNKGRPIVIEFMYDQGTQRDLVAANQQNLRFFGERAGDTMRINSMLYNWKSVASLMSIRTLCNADTVILKLLFDVSQILELLGACEPIMLRLQQLRANSNETMRLERAKRASASTATQSMMSSTPSRGTWSSGRNSTPDNNGNARSQSSNSYVGRKLVPDSYGGMKLVPE